MRNVALVPALALACLSFRLLAAADVEVLLDNNHSASTVRDAVSNILAEVRADETIDAGADASVVSNNHAGAAAAHVQDDFLAGDAVTNSRLMPAPIHLDMIDEGDRARENIFLDYTALYVAKDDYGLRIFDVAAPYNPTNAGYGGYTPIDYDVFGAGQSAYVASESIGITVYDVADPTNPMRSVVVGTTNRAHIGNALRLTPRTSPPLNPVAGDIYINANATNRLTVFDGTAWQACW